MVGVTAPRPCRRCRKVVMQLLHAFRRLGSVLRGVLPPAVYVDVAARLVQGVCTRLIGTASVLHCKRTASVLQAWVVRGASAVIMVYVHGTARLGGAGAGGAVCVGLGGW